MEYFLEGDIFDVGTETDAYCTSCKTDTPHTVVTKFEGEIRSVQCSICNATHSFRPPRGEPDDDVPEPTTVRRKHNLKKLPWSVAMKELDTDSPRRYTPREGYGEGEVISHGSFGVGYIAELVGDTKLEAIFSDGPRILVHDRSAVRANGGAVRTTQAPRRARKAQAKANPAAVPEPISADGDEKVVGPRRSKARSRAKGHAGQSAATATAHVKVDSSSPPSRSTKSRPSSRTSGSTKAKPTKQAKAKRAKKASAAATKPVSKTRVAAKSPARKTKAKRPATKTRSAKPSTKATRKTTSTRTAKTPRVAARGTASAKASRNAASSKTTGNKRGTGKKPVAGKKRPATKAARSSAASKKSPSKGRAANRKASSSRVRAASATRPAKSKKSEPPKRRATATSRRTSPARSGRANGASNVRATTTRGGAKTGTKRAKAGSRRVGGRSTASSRSRR